MHVFAESLAGSLPSTGKEATRRRYREDRALLSEIEGEAQNVYQHHEDGELVAVGADNLARGAMWDGDRDPRIPTGARNQDARAGARREWERRIRWG